jgi:DNA-directed RNA polymerase omega subunit
MNDSYLERAIKQIKDPKVLSILAAKRARELARGGKKLIKTDDKEFVDIALLEIAEGLVVPEFADDDD